LIDVVNLQHIVVNMLKNIIPQKQKQKQKAHVIIEIYQSAGLELLFL